VNALTRSRG